MVLSGIRPSFPSLSRSTGQITHVLLTRSPLEHPHHKNDAGLSVRLACVKHAASVRPEPGSNSPKKQTKKLTGKKQRNQQNKNKQQTPTTTIDAHVRVHVHVHIQTKFASSNDTLSSSQTTPPPTTQHPKSTGPQTATTQIYKPHPKTTNHHVTTTKTGKNYTKFASLHS